MEEARNVCNMPVIWLENDDHDHDGDMVRWGLGWGYIPNGCSCVSNMPTDRQPACLCHCSLVCLVRWLFTCVCHVCTLWCVTWSLLEKREREREWIVELAIGRRKTMTMSKKKRLFHLSLAGICFSLTFFSCSFSQQERINWINTKTDMGQELHELHLSKWDCQEIPPWLCRFSKLFVVVRSSLHISSWKGEFPVSSLTFSNTHSSTLDTFFKVILSGMVKGKVYPVEELSLLARNYRLTTRPLTSKNTNLKVKVSSSWYSS